MIKVSGGRSIDEGMEYWIESLKNRGGITVKKIYPIFLVLLAMCLYACEATIALQGITLGAGIVSAGMAGTTYLAESDTELQEINKQLLMAG